jgi:hypothetical protein
MLNKLIALTILIPSASFANDICIRDPDIKNTEIVNETTILFHMRDHKTWKNTLPVRCFGLRQDGDGFSYQPTDPGMQELCSQQVTIKLNDAPTFCQLGDFTLVAKTVPKP